MTCTQYHTRVNQRLTTPPSQVYADPALKETEPLPCGLHALRNGDRTASGNEGENIGVEVHGGGLEQSADVKRNKNK